MISKEDFIRLIKLTKTTITELNKYEKLDINLGESCLIESHWGIGSILYKYVFTELQLDYLNWWMYEINFGENKKDFNYKINDKNLYTGMGIGRVYETIIKIK